MYAQLLSEELTTQNLQMSIHLAQMEVDVNVVSRR